MGKRIARAGVAVATAASLGVGFGLVVGGGPAGATQAASSNQLTPVLQQVESLVCLVVDIATGATPPYGPPGDVCAN